MAWSTWPPPALHHLPPLHLHLLQPPVHHQRHHPRPAPPPQSKLHRQRQHPATTLSPALPPLALLALMARRLTLASPMTILQATAGASGEAGQMPGRGLSGECAGCEHSDGPLMPEQPAPAMYWGCKESARTSFLLQSPFNPIPWWGPLMAIIRLTGMAWFCQH